MNFPKKTDPEFESLFMHILDVSSKDSTYKFAFARFLLDYSMEHNDKPHVSFSTIAEYFLKYYWVQECKSKLVQSFTKTIKKNNKNIPRILAIRRIIIDEFGEKYYPQKYKEIKEIQSKKIENCIKQIVKRCFDQVTYAFQNIQEGNKIENVAPVFFHYDVVRYKEKPGRTFKIPIIDYKKGICINPDAMSFFRRYNIALQKAVTLEWTRFIEKLNIGIPALIRKVEGDEEERKSTSKERKALQQFFKNCFYCNTLLLPGKETHVEHVIPFRYMRENEMWNLVLACNTCNSEKLGSLPSRKYFDILLNRNKNDRKKIDELDKSLSKLGDNFEKIICDHYQHAKDHGFRPFDNFSKLNSNL